MRVRAATHAATRMLTQIARPMRSFLTYGSRIRRVRKGVDSDCKKNTRTGSNSYWWEMTGHVRIMYTILFHARWDKNKSAAADKIDMLVYIKVSELIDRAEEGLNQTKRKETVTE